jgi:undecaprenyl-diphosphatase
MTLPLFDALLLGIVEGLTEFLPVSSTGHLILVHKWLEQNAGPKHNPTMDAYLVVIQLGALLAAVWHYRRTYVGLLTGVLRQEPAALRLFRNLCLSSLPVLVLGFFANKWIKEHLFRPIPVASALMVGGVVMLVMDLYVRRRRQSRAEQANPAALSTSQALLIGGVQALALWPGTSRSMSCIVGGQLAGLCTAAAADFTFLLALPTLGAATVYELLKGGRGLIAAVGAVPMALGMGTAFVVGLLVITAFLRYLRRFGLWPFGCYRIAVGLLLLSLL